MIALRPVHDGIDAPAIARQMDKHRVVPLRRFCDAIPRDLETVIEKAMSKHRDRRYETANDFAADLRSVLAGEPTAARAQTLVDRAAHWALRHRRGVVTTAFLALFGMVGFGLAMAKIAVEKQRSDANAIRAERGERLARGAVDRLGAQMAELLADNPAAEPIRRRLLAETLNYYQQFAASANDDPELRKDVAITYGKMGVLRGELGEGDEAIKALRESERLYASLSAESPTASNIALDWSISQNNLAQSLHQAGYLQESASYFAMAIRTQERLLSEDVADDVELSLATTLNNLAMLLGQSGATDEAESAYLRALKILESGETTLSAESWQSRLASLNANLSGLLTKRDPSRAIRFAQAALNIQTQTLHANRDNAVLSAQIVSTLNTLGAAQSANGQTDSAIVSFERSVEVGEQLLLRWPDQPTYRRDYVISLNHLGLAMSKSGRSDDARRAFERASSEGRPLATEYSDDAQTQSMLGSIMNNLGFLYQQAGENAAAHRAYDEAIKLQSLAVKLAPQVELYRKHLQKCDHNRQRMRGAI
jgi:tetratricopeptide (TPR) repeat protein